MASDAVDASSIPSDVSMTDTPRLSLFASGVHRVLPGQTTRSIVQLAVMAEEAGFDQFVLPDHIVMGNRIDRYPYGSTQFHREDPWPEPITLLAAIACATKSIRLGTGVIIASLRPGPLLAKQVATLDELSDGRVDLGVGVGWQREEYEAMGLSYEHRWDIFDDVLTSCRTLWADSSDSIRCRPLPRQQPVPVFIGARPSQALARRIVTYKAGWMPLTSARPDDVLTSLRLLRELVSAIDSDAPPFASRAGWPYDESAAKMLLGAGVTTFSVRLSPKAIGWRGIEEELRTTCRAFGKFADQQSTSGLSA